MKTAGLNEKTKWINGCNVKRHGNFRREGPAKKVEGDGKREAKQLGRFCVGKRFRNRKNQNLRPFKGYPWRGVII